MMGTPATNTRSLRSREKSHMRDLINALERDSPDSMMPHSGGKGKRKHRDSGVTVSTTPKKPRLAADNSEEPQDVYCWECRELCTQEEGNGALDCAMCPRTFHDGCGGADSADRKDESSAWICPVCQQIMRAECSETRSWAMQLLSRDQLSVLLLFAIGRMRHADSEAFQNPVPKLQFPDYYETIFHPMDLSTLEKLLKKKAYASTDAFLKDAEWILHNCIIYNGPSSKITTDARLILRIAKHEMTEIELCPDCYLNSCERKDDWFAQPCTYPHCLVWARLKGFPFWPAKALRIGKNGTVDVRFFGPHDRSWIPQNQIYLLSEEPPLPVKNPKKWKDYDGAIEELGKHCELIKERSGEFTFAPAQTEFKPEYLHQCRILFGENVAKKSGSRVLSFEGRSRRHPSGSSEGSDELASLVTPARAADRSRLADGLRPGSACSSQSGFSVDTVGDTPTDQQHPVKGGGGPRARGKQRVVPVVEETGTPPTSASANSAKSGDRVSTNGIFTPTTELAERPPPDNEPSPAADVDLRSKLAPSEEHLSSLERIGQSLRADKDAGESPAPPDAPAPAPAPQPRPVPVARRTGTPVNAAAAIAAKRSSSTSDESTAAAKPATVSGNNSSESPAATAASAAIVASSTAKTATPVVPTATPDISVQKKKTLDLCIRKLNSHAQRASPVQSIAAGPSTTPKPSTGSSTPPPAPSVAAPTKSGSPAPAAPAPTLSSACTLGATDSSDAQKSAFSKYASKILDFLEGTFQDMIQDIPTTSTHKDHVTPSATPKPEPPPTPTLPPGAKIMTQADENVLAEAKSNMVKLNSMQLEIKRSKWLLQQAVEEMKHNTKLSLSEIESDRVERRLEECRKQFEEEKIKLVSETKTKQWCAQCAKEAVFYCCWNTSYCDYPCQQAHWPKHMNSCAQINQQGSGPAGTPSPSQGGMSAGVPQLGPGPPTSPMGVMYSHANVMPYGPPGGHHGPPPGHQMIGKGGPMHPSAGQPPPNAAAANMMYAARMRGIGMRR